MVQPDPWNTFVNDSSADSINNVQLTTNESQSQSFEDNFQPTSNVDGLPDSKEYLQSLGKLQATECKINKMKKKKSITNTHISKRIGFLMRVFFFFISQSNKVACHSYSMLILCLFSLFRTSNDRGFLWYFIILERKLQKLRKNANVVEQLQARREQCMENLLRGNLTLHDSDSENLARLEEDFEESRRRNITRYINPEQAVNSSELVHIINHDHLDKSVEQSENGQEDSDINTGE